jgi:hypothetical protein
MGGLPDVFSLIGLVILPTCKLMYDVVITDEKFRDSGRKRK